MSFKVVCRTEGTEDNYSNYDDAEMAVNRHHEDGHKAFIVALSSTTIPQGNTSGQSVRNYSPFRINKKVATLDYRSTSKQKTNELLAASPEEGNDTDGENKRYNFYFEKLIKLVPAEVVGVYLALYPLGNNSDGTFSDSWGYWISIICFFLVFISRIFGTKVSGYSTFKYFKTAQWKSIIIAAISFVIWIYAMGHEFAGFEVTEHRIVQAAVVFWTFVIPLLYKGEE